jgi:hypothetical protein
VTDLLQLDFFFGREHTAAFGDFELVIPMVDDIPFGDAFAVDPSASAAGVSYNSGIGMMLVKSRTPLSPLILSRNSLICSAEP